MAGVPDPLGGIGYANVFKGNEATDDWVDDLKYKQAVKAKKAEQQAKLKLDIPFLDGWASKDTPELNQLYGALANKGASMLAQGVDPMTNPQFLGQTQKATLLAAAGKEHEATFNKGISELDALLKTGDITPDQYREAKKGWMDYADAGIEEGKVGRIAARMQLTPPSNPMPFNADDYANKQISVLDQAAKVKTPTLNSDGTISTDERVPQATIQKQLNYNSEYLKAQGVPQDRIDRANDKIKNAFGYTKTRTEPSAEKSGIGIGTSRGGLVAVPSFEDLGKVNFTRPKQMLDGVIKSKQDRGADASEIEPLKEWKNNLEEVEKAMESKRVKAIDFRVEGKNPPANRITLKRSTLYADSEKLYTQNPNEYISMTFTPTKGVDLENGDFLVTGTVKGASLENKSEQSNKESSETQTDTNEGTNKTTSTNENTTTTKEAEGGNVTILLKKGSPEKKNFENVYLTDDDIETWMKGKGAEYKKLGSDTWNQTQKSATPTTQPSTTAPQKAAMPKAGEVVNGYKYLGGNTNDQKSWQKVGGQSTTTPSQTTQTSTSGKTSDFWNLSKEEKKAHIQGIVNGAKNSVEVYFPPNLNGGVEIHFNGDYGSHKDNETITFKKGEEIKL